jgi:hypothetical protein
MSNNYFTDNDVYIKNLIIEKKENYIYNYPFLKDFLKNKKFIYKLDFNYNHLKNSSSLLGKNDLNQILLTKIQHISAKLHLKNLKGGIKWIICSYEFSDNFYDCASFHLITFDENYKNLNELNFIKLGVLFQRYHIYKTNLIPNNIILCGDDNSFGMIEIE